MLKSYALQGNKRFELCATAHAHHIAPGDAGPHVGTLQQCLLVLDACRIDQGELKNTKYGKSTAEAVLAYKTKRKIINKSYQSAPDNIVGIMTIKSLDDEMVAKQRAPSGSGDASHKSLSGFATPPMGRVARPA